MCGAPFEKRFAISMQGKELCKYALLSLIDRCPEWLCILILVLINRLA